MLSVLFLVLGSYAMVHGLLAKKFSFRPGFQILAGGKRSFFLGWTAQGGRLSAAAMAAGTEALRGGYRLLILARNSPFDLVLLSLSISSSMASTGESGFRTLRRTQIRVRSSLGISSSSLR